MKKSIKITEHARKRMQKYDLHESMVFEALTKPDDLIEGVMEERSRISL